MAVIKVGAATETELKEKKHRIEDALSATRAAVEEGIVPGGGVALIRARAAVTEVLEGLEGDEATGATSCVNALDAPARQIAQNAGLEGAVVVQQIERETGGHRPQRRHRRVRGPARGRRHRPGEGHPRALQNAASIAALLLTTEALVADKPEEEGAGGGMPGGMPGGMGGMGMM